MTPILLKGSQDPDQLDLTQDMMNLDIDDGDFTRYFSLWCDLESATFIQDLQPNKPQSLRIEPNASGPGSVIFFNDEYIGSKICISLEDFRELLLRSVNGDGSSFIKYKGHVVSLTKDGVFQILWAASNIGDSGANEIQNLISKFFEGERNVTNTKVNFVKPIAKQRGSR